MTEVDEKHFGDHIICQFCGKEIFVDKVRDHFHLTSEHRGLSQSNFNINVKKESKVILFHLYFIISVIMIVIHFVKC